jgi:hypothetical protein
MRLRSKPLEVFEHGTFRCCLAPCLRATPIQSILGVELIFCDIFDQVPNNDYILSRFKLEGRAIQETANSYPSPDHPKQRQDTSLSNKSDAPLSLTSLHSLLVLNAVPDTCSDTDVCCNHSTAVAIRHSILNRLDGLLGKGSVKSVALSVNHPRH